MVDTATTRTVDRNFDVVRPIKRWTDATVNSGVAFAGALGKVYTEFGQSVTEQNVGKLDLSNGFLRGAVAGWTVAFEEVPKAITRFYDVLLDLSALPVRKRTRATKRSPGRKRTVAAKGKRSKS